MIIKGIKGVLHKITEPKKAGDKFIVKLILKQSAIVNQDTKQVIKKAQFFPVEKFISSQEDLDKYVAHLGEAVEMDCYLNGREWESNGELVYFTQLAFKDLKVIDS